MSKAQAARGALAALVDAYKRTFDPETYYHGTHTTDITKFRRGSYFSTDPEYVSENYAKSIVDYSSPVIYPVKIKTDNIFDYRDEKSVRSLIKRIEEEQGEPLPYYVENNLYIGDYSAYERFEVQDIIENMGYKGYRTDEPGTVALFHPDKGDVRSIHAKFDPEKSESGNILASVPAAALFTLGGAGALSNLADE